VLYNGVIMEMICIVLLNGWQTNKIYKVTLAFLFLCYRAGDNKIKYH
jgi:hypothetical protein